MYNILCDSLHITPSPNNGTLRLPLKPVGLHSDNKDRPSTTVEDFPATVNGHTVSSAMSAQTSGVLRPDEPGHGSNSTEKGEADASKADTWWTYFSNKIDEAKAWLDGFVHPTAQNDG